MALRLIIVVPESEEEATREVLSDLAVAKWEQSIHLSSGPTRRGQGQTARLEAKRILRLADDLEADCLLIAKEVCCDQRILDARHDLDIRRPAMGLLRKKRLKEELEARGLSWRHRLNHRLQHWDSRKSDVDDWLKQFELVGRQWIGEGLLRQVDILPPDELRRAFEPSAQIKLGANFVFTYILDSDQASSSNRIGAMLNRMYGSVHHFADALPTAPSGSRVVVCEDALWTGTEVRKQLERLMPSGELHDSVIGKRILFRHGIVTDYGIWVCRHFLERNELADVAELWLGERQRFVQALNPELSENVIRAQWHLSPAEFDAWLSTHVRPLVFQDEKVWQNRQVEAQRVCQAIGSQLIHQYAAARAKDWSEAIKQGFAIGAGRLGSALVLAHGVPKVCLPLFWLGGHVSVDSTEFEWKPLFFDARRTVPGA